MDAGETLFSLELAINTTRLVPRTLICRMPAVAFRLLDFPSIIIQQIESRELKQLKDVIHLTWENEESVPIQLEELKDRHGNYEFNKGKSSLFKYNLSLLQSHLLNTPLYVMIIDLWNDAPKLIGHCNVALDDVVNEIKADVMEFGISVPSVHGMQGRFPVFNLMGSEIGWISLGIRLLSLGGNLIPHIPDTALARRRSTVHQPLGDVDVNLPQSRPNPTTTTSKRKSDENVDDGRVRATTKCDDASMPKKVEVMKPTWEEELIENNHVEHPRETKSVSHDNGHQTLSINAAAASRTNSDHHMPIRDSEQASDAAFITNTHIPPPLYFNAGNEQTAKRKAKHHPQLKPTFHLHPADTARHSFQSDSNSSSSYVGTRRELEVHYVLHPPQYHSSPSVRKTLRKNRREKSEILQQNSDSLAAGESKPSVADRRDQENISLPSTEHTQQMPILNALLRELNLLYRRDDSALPPLPIVNNFLQAPPGKQSTGKQESHPKEERSSHHQESKPVQVKPHPQKAYRHKHRDCAKPPAGVPASKGWLRQEPVVRKKKPTKLQFKMTNSQKLRLQRHNPEAFQLLEEEERLAEIQFQIHAAQLEEEKAKKEACRRAKRPTSARQHPPEELYQIQDRNVSTEIARHLDIPEGHGYLAGLETYKITSGGLDAGDPGWQGQNTDQLQHITEATHGPVHQSALKTPLENDVSGSEKSIHSISIRLPSALDQNETGDQDSASESSNEDSQGDEPKAVAAPGFREDIEDDPEDGAKASAVNDLRTSEQVVYSDDFNDSYKFESTGEQELASIKSSEASYRASPQSSHSEQPSVSEDHHPTSHSTVSSYKTAESVESASSARGNVVDTESKRSVVPSKSSGSSSSKHQTSVLSIPQPQMSANSPIPLARRSIAKSVAFDQGSHFQPPRPKPRHSLERTNSSISNASLLAPDLTLSGDTSAVNISDLKPDVSSDYQLDDNYSDDFDSDDN